MKKLILALVLALVMTGAFAYAETAADETVAAEGEWIAPAAGEAVTLEKDLGVLIENVFYPVYTPVDELMAVIGEPLETISSPSCVFEGEDFEFDYEYGSLFTNPIDGKNVWYEFYIFDVGMSTSRGLSVGDTVEKMLELYGDGYYAEGEDMYTYSLSGDPEDYGSPCLIFEAEEGLIVTIDIYYPTNI